MLNFKQFITENPGPFVTRKKKQKKKLGKHIPKRRIGLPPKRKVEFPIHSHGKGAFFTSTTN